ncbi:preprotein translocase subunit SecE [Rubritalea squalenifaciens DSM 18772]|uniref:Preprotein translocase subunit SecE n=2 Tax=Rubritalea TaxID=361050 RepID=A0A1M6ELG5_9BACT|nr:preprotein translocase subunit SecE [Rubritalea squalenifaciens]SHI86293.1 preprotein translocase subunit SecE [Rubritalea squalenifaciens DSM 18772]
MFEKITTFIGEVKSELRKATWPWDPDPKARGFKKYKELVDSTVVVLIAITLLAGFVAVSDVLLMNAIQLISKFFAG